MRFALLRPRSRAGDRGSGTPRKLPLSGKKSSRKSSNASHSTGSKTDKTSLEPVTHIGEATHSASWAWEQLEADLVRRMASKPPTHPHHPPLHISTQYSSARMVQRVPSHPIVDPGFEARQKKWLEVTKKSIQLARRKEQEEVFDEPAEKEPKEQRCNTPQILKEEERLPREFSDVTPCHNSSDAEVPSNVRDIVSYDDDLSATSFEVLMTWIGCYDSFDESECDKFDPHGLVTNRLQSGVSKRDRRRRKGSPYK